MKKLLKMYACLFLLGYVGLEAQAQRMPIQEFIAKTYFHGVPYMEAKAYGPQAVPALLQMLDDARMEPHRINILSTIGMIGSSTATQPLIRFFESRQGNLSYIDFISTLVVFQAMGYIAQGGDDKAYNYLVKWVQADQWQKSGLTFSYGSYQGPKMGQMIREIAIQGLGISGRADALERLLALARQVDNQAQDNSSISNLHQIIHDAIHMNQEIQTLGAEHVFSEEDHH